MSPRKVIRLIKKKSCCFIRTTLQLYSKTKRPHEYEKKLSLVCSSKILKLSVRGKSEGQERICICRYRNYVSELR